MVQAQKTMIKIFRSYNIWLFIIIVIAGFLRFYNIDKVPVSLYWDEVSQGYNAYSISTNLRDEYGTFLPLLFRSFNDYKMPLNIYLTALSIKIMGLSEFVVRFPSALFGTLTVLVTFLLAGQFLKRSGWLIGQKYSDTIALLSSSFLAISPWHIQFSRASFEANISLFFIVLGAYLFLKGLEKYRYYLFSFISFAVACYGYRSVHVFLPVLLLGLFIAWKKELVKKGIFRVGLGVLLFGLLVLPLLNPLMREGASRFQQTSISIRVNEIALNNFQKGIDTNRKVLYGKIFLQNYISQFSPQFLFISGDPNRRHSPAEMGLLYLWEIPFLLTGLYVVFKYFSFPVKASMLIWLLASPLPAVLSVPAPHALRSLNILPIPQILTAIGVFYIFFLLTKNIRKIYLVALIFLIMFFFVRYIDLYNYSNTKSNVADWADGYKQLTEYVFTNEKSYDKVIISGHYWQPYIYFLFYKKYDPAMYQKYGTTNGFDKYLFGGTSWDKDKNSQELGSVNLKQFANVNKILIALSEEEYSMQKGNINKLTEIKNHNSETVFIVGEVK